MTENHETEARDHLASRLAEMRAYLDFDGDPDEGPENLGPIFDYGLEWTKATTDHRDRSVTYVHVLSTGGPHEEFRVTFHDDDYGEAAGVTFVYLPWFGRVEIELYGDDLATARDFYGSHYGDAVDFDTLND